MTLVRGPSDTGKSFIVNAIDFMLGAKKLKEIPEGSGYSDVLLGFLLPSGESITLSRSMGGGSFGLHLANVRRGPLPQPAKRLAAQHSATSRTTLSHFLLETIDLADKVLRTNVNNVTNSLSFRDIAHLSVVGETKMQSEVPPALTGRYTTKTREVSALKLLLQNDDDSGLEPTTAKKDAKRISGAKLEVIDQLVAEYEEQLGPYRGVDEIRNQLVRLAQPIEQHEGALTETTRERDLTSSRRSLVQRHLRVRRLRLDQATTLQSRFGLLKDKYDSDMDRLDMIGEAGSLLAYFRPGECVVCGAAPENQHHHGDEAPPQTLSSATSAERAKTKLLHDDLLLTLADVAASQESLEAAIRDYESELGQLSESLADLDARLRPQQEGLKELLELRANLDKSLEIHDRINALQRMKMAVAENATTEAGAVATGLGLRPLQELSQEMSNRLRAWGFPEAELVRYDRNEQDIVSADQLRSAHGKGVRSILHAAFTVALAQYCFDRELPHPGFIVLDSPLVTYRAPDAPESAGPDQSVATAFYKDLEQNFDGQAIVVENTDPLEALSPETTDIQFTALHGEGRFGFLPRV
jgi:hypothetical protein